MIKLIYSLYWASLHIGEAKQDRLYVVHVVYEHGSQVHVSPWIQVNLSLSNEQLTISHRIFHKTVTVAHSRTETKDAEGGPEDGAEVR